MCNSVRSFQDTCNFFTEMFAALSGISVLFSFYLPKGSHESRSEAGCPSGAFFFLFEEVRKGVKKQGKKENRGERSLKHGKRDGERTSRKS